MRRVDTCTVSTRLVILSRVRLGLYFKIFLPSTMMTCPRVEASTRRPYGYGTEKVEEKIMELFPGVPVARMDLDTTRSRNAYERIINDFSAGRTKILIGTQMVSKGLDFDHVRVVGILNACLLYTSPSPRDGLLSRMPSSA